MTPEPVDNPGVDTGRADSFGASIYSGIYVLVLAAITISYLALWLNVIRLHLMQGDFLGAAVTFLVALGVFGGAAFSVDWIGSE